MNEDMNEDIADEAHDGSAANFGEVAVTGPGVSITRPVDEATMSSIIAILFGGAPAASAGRGAGGVGGSGRERGRGQGGGGQQSSQSVQWEDDLTLGEFISETEAKTFPHKICAAGYYLINMQGAESFTRDDVRTALVSAHEDLPGNYARDWSNAASSHLIAEKPGESGQFFVPKTGRTAVESRFQDVPRRRSSRRTTKKAAASNEDAG